MVRRLAPLLLAAALLAAGKAGAAVPASAPGDLSPRLSELAQPSLRSIAPAVQADALGVAAAGAGSLLREGDRVLADVRFERGAVAGVERLRAAGGKVVAVSPRYQRVTVAVRPADLAELAAVPRVGAVTEILAPLVSASSCAGLVTSEGDSQLTAAAARSDFNVDGAGVGVGILSDSFDRATGAPTRAAADVASGDLPGTGNRCDRTAPVGVLGDPAAEGSDEGRAMAQIVHDLAPGASIRFASAFTGELGFADNIRALASGGADVIVDDVAYFEEPFFQDGPVAVAVNDVAAAGKAYFAAAGNENQIDAEGRNFASWEAPGFRDTACPPELQAIGREACMDFDPAAGTDPAFGISVADDATLTVDLQWAQPWNGVTADLDAFLLDADGKPIEDAEAVEDNVGGSQKPVEILQWENDTGQDQDVALAIDRCFAACNPAADPAALPRLKFILLQGGGVVGTEYRQSAGGDVVGPTIFGHSAAAGAMSVAAVRFNDSSKPEDFSSRGPVAHYFGPVTGAAAAAPIQPKAISKPDLAATDGGANTFFGQLVAGVWRFFGTSAAAPHAAAVAALMREANPSLSPEQLRLALAATARPVGSSGVDAVGAGLVDAHAAVGSVALPPTVAIGERPPPLGRNARPSIGFEANRPASFACSIDRGGLRPCGSPFVPATRLSEGTHGFVVRATDAAGRSAQSEIVWFRIDTRRPRTFFRKRPRKTIRSSRRKTKVVFRVRSNEKGATFICRVDGGLPRFCKRRFVRRFRVGRHVVRVKARDAAGNVDRSPAVHRFKVKRRRR